MITAKNVGITLKFITLAQNVSVIVIPNMSWRVK